MKTILSGLKQLLCFIFPNVAKHFYLFSFIFLRLATLTAQVDSLGTIKALLKDKETGEVIPFGNVVLYQRSVQVGVGTTNMDGEVIFKKLKPGTYNAKGIFIGYQAASITGIKVVSGKTAYIVLPLAQGSGVELQEVEIITYDVPLIDPDTKSGQSIAREEYTSLPIKSQMGVSSNNASAHQNNSGRQNNARGGRAAYAHNSLDAIAVSGVPTSYGDPGAGGIVRYKIGGGNAPSPGPGVNAGILTAGELNDFKKWEHWTDYSKPALEGFSKTWNLALDDRYVLQLMNKDRRPLYDALVKLEDKNGEALWEARTDHTGKAELWAHVGGDEKKPDRITVIYGGEKKVMERIKTFNKGINLMKIDQHCASAKDLDIVFMVDATGSMGDEIEFLKVEMNDILKKTTSLHREMKLRTGSIFYKCEGNSYVTKISGFSEQAGETINFIKQQRADEGGEEAVEIALEEAVNKFAWTENNAVRLLFVVMDEPPGSSPEKLIKIHTAMREAAKKGIHIIPIVASGGTDSPEMQKSMEYLMRCIALATNGTYVFLTDDSGVGFKHAAPKTPEYDVELLNKLIVRLIKQFTASPCQTPAFDGAIGKDTTIIEIIKHVVLDSTAIARKENLETHDDTASIAIALSSEEIKKPSEKFKFFPNPCRGVLNIECDLDLKEVFFCDINGKILERIEIGKRDKLSLELNNYPAALYLLRFKSGEEWYTGKLVLVGN